MGNDEISQNVAIGWLDYLIYLFFDSSFIVSTTW